MNKTPVIAIFDVGKTNKKLFLFNEQYRIVFEKTARFTETTDEDGDACENLESLRLSVFDSLREVFRYKEFDIRAVNFSSYGASLVYIDEKGRPLTPLYNYLKPYPAELQEQFYARYGGQALLAQQTASPVLGSLNAGMQLYRLKHERPGLFEAMKYALHLPQYLSYLITGIACSDLTSIGCHTHLWDFQRKDYHDWVKQEGLLPKLAPLMDAQEVLPAVFPGNSYAVGIGLHDSSAALIPYLLNFHEPFILISTGTWCISLNPFNLQPLTAAELQQDCLCYLTYLGLPVKASRLFAGYEHEEQARRIAAHFNQETSRYRNMPFDGSVAQKLKKSFAHICDRDTNTLPGTKSIFAQRDLHSFETDTEAYHQLIIDLVEEQFHSTQLVLTGTNVKRIFVDGGFSKNAIYMNLLAARFPSMEIFAASMAQATAVGAALCIHASWNQQSLPADIIELKYYSAI